MWQHAHPASQAERTSQAAAPILFQVSCSRVVPWTLKMRLYNFWAQALLPEHPLQWPGQLPYRLQEESRFWRLQRYAGSILVKEPCRLQGRGSSCCLQGYTLGNLQLDFTINIAINYTVGNTTTSETIQINPSVPFVLSPSQQLSAQLLGDLASYTALPVLSTKYLMVPHPQSEFWGLFKIPTVLMDLSAQGE